MAHVGSKTPISLLQEFSNRIKQQPSYELVINGVGSHKPLFVYQVTVGAHFAEGQGSSKQEAKQDAARNLIYNLGLDENPDVSREVKNLAFPQEENLKYNSSGELAEHCLKNNFPEPTYQLVHEEGPPHAKSFIMKCSVSHQNEEACAGTKKLAKRLAAHKMLRRLKELAGEDFQALVQLKSNLNFEEQEPQPPSPLPPEVTTKYFELSTRARFPSSLVKQPATKYKSHYKTLSGFGYNSNTFELLKNSNWDSGEAVKGAQYMETIAAELNLLLEFTELPFKDESSDANATSVKYLIKVNTFPVLAEIGSTKDEAAARLLERFLSVCS